MKFHQKNIGALSNWRYSVNLRPGSWFNEILLLVTSLNYLEMTHSIEIDKFRWIGSTFTRSISSVVFWKTDNKTFNHQSRWNGFSKVQKLHFSSNEFNISKKSFSLTNYYCNEKELHRPGIEPGSQEWESRMIPLHQRCTVDLHYF